MTSALILAAGFGTRLQPLTSELPKPVVPVGDRPLLSHVALACRAGGVSSLVANAYHEHQKLSSIINELSLDIQVVVEEKIRGTAGGVAGARSLYEPGAVLVWNGDILTHAPVKELLELASGLDAQVLAVNPRAAGEGTVGLDEQGSVVRLRGQVFGREVRSGDYIGVSALGPSVVAGLPESGCLFGEVALPHLQKGGRVWSVPSAAPWSDLGDLAQYVAANFRWLDGHLRRDSQPTTHDPSSWIAPSASVAPSVSVERCLIGARARVGGTGRLSEVIAWPGAVVWAPLARAVVLASGRVVPFEPPAEK
jgi:NDP-sugar pyrophosphorylase family protein